MDAVDDSMANGGRKWQPARPVEVPPDYSHGPRALADQFGYGETSAEDGSVVVTRAGWRVVDITTERVEEFLAARRASGVKLDTSAG